MRFETIAVAAAISVETEGKDTFFHLSKEAQSRKEPIEAFSGPRNGGFFGDKRRVLSNDRVRQWSEATNLQSEHAKGASAEADIGILASTSKQNIHRLQGRNRRFATSTVAERYSQRFLEEDYDPYAFLEKLNEICPYGGIFIGRFATLKNMSRPLASQVEIYCSLYDDGNCNTCEVTNLYEYGVLSGYTISMDCPAKSRDIISSPLFNACEGYGLGFELSDNAEELCAVCEVDLETNSVDMRDCNISNIGYDVDTVLYNKGYSEFYADTQFFLKYPIAEFNTCRLYYDMCSRCGATFVSDLETGMPTESYNFAIDCTNIPDYDFSFEEISLLKTICECGVCTSCNIDGDKKLVEFVDCNINRATEEFYQTINAFIPSAVPSDVPSDVPSTPSPSLSSIPSVKPSSSAKPSLSPSLAPSDVPSGTPSASLKPSSSPSAAPSDVPSLTPSLSPSSTPSSACHSTTPSASVAILIGMVAVCMTAAWWHP